MPGVQLNPDAHYLLTFDPSSSGGKNVTYPWATNGQIGQISILLPTMTGALSASLTVEASNARYFSRAPVTPSQAPITPGDSTNDFMRSVTAFNQTDSMFGASWVDITVASFVTIGNGFVLINAPCRLIRLANGSVSSLTSSNFAYCWHDNISIGY